MTRPLDCSEMVVRELYESQKLSISEIAERLNCSPSTLRRNIHRWGIKLRSRSEAARIKRAKDPDRLVHIPEEELKYLYKELEFSPAEIAEKYGCSKGVVFNRLHQYGIALPPPGRARVEISKQELEELYIGQKLSLRQIAERYCCNHSTIRNKLDEYRLNRRTYAEANLIYPKRNFEGDLSDRAYLVGFRLGDLHVTTLGDTGQTIVVECATTKQEQLDLIADLFGSYGHVFIGNQKQRGDIGIACYLNMSFAFLLSKEDAAPEWVQVNSKAAIAFVAGYIDAEGSFFVVKDGSARFAISSYDGGIISWLYQWMSEVGVRCPQPRLVGRKGTIRPNGAIYRKNLWTLSVNRKDSLFRLIELLEPHLKHPKRCRDMEQVRLNIKAPTL